MGAAGFGFRKRTKSWAQNKENRQKACISLFIFVSLHFVSWRANTTYENNTLRMTHMTDDSKNYKLLAYRAYAVRDIFLETMCHKCHLSYIGLRRWSTFPVLFRQKSRWFLQEITATSWGNHGNNCKKSRQLLKEITVISVGSSGFFANYSPAGQMGQMGQRFSETLRVPRVRGTRIIFINYCPICPICPKTSLSEQK